MLSDLNHQHPMKMSEHIKRRPAPVKGAGFLNFILGVFAFFLSLMLWGADAYAAESTTDPVKICIDPGHGGENLGADWQGYLEKEMTLITAEAMKEELLKYDGIEVYMTRTEDMDLSLQERVDYADEVGADFFFCLHYNMSADHDMYGAECWVSAFDTKYARGMDFARIEMRLLTDTGLYDRGIKTRLNGEGTNYYGVLRMADEVGMPGIIIEHCHLDHPNDEPFYDAHDMLVEYGKLDATAVAMYYGLYSEELDKDYRDYTYEPTPVPDDVVKPDDTAPDKLDVLFGNPYETEDGYYIDAEITASDPDSRMLYYSYSTDGGIHWSERYRWADDGSDLIGDSILKDTIHTTIPIRDDRDMYVIFKVYNLYNLDTVSSPFFVEKAPSKEEIEADSESGESVSEGYDGYTEIERVEDDQIEDSPKEGRKLSGNLHIYVFAILALMLLLVLSFMGYFTYAYFKRRGK